MNHENLWKLQKYQIQLRVDFDEICFQRKIQLPPPTFEVSEAITYYGRWDPLLKKIEISLHLINNYSWEFVIEVLKHEMAHLVVSDHFHASDQEPPHGLLFTKACDLLDVQQHFRKATGNLPNHIKHWKELRSEKAQNKILCKVEKLMALSSSCNEHEALLAMSKVQDLYLKYNLENIENDTCIEHQSLIINTKKQKVPAHITLVSAILQKHYFTQVIFSWIYDAKTFKTYKTLVLLGTEENLLMAEYVYFFLLQQCDQLWLDFKNKYGCTLREKRSFLLGLLTGFNKKLNSMKEEKKIIDPKHKQLIHIGNSKLNQFTEYKFPRTSRRSSSSSRVKSETYDKGFNEGQKIKIFKGIHNKSKTHLFLTGK